MFNRRLFIFLLLLSPCIKAGTCQHDQVNLQVLGSGGPELDDGRNSSSYIIWHQNKAKILVDSGPGASTSFSQTGAKFEDIESVLFTHFHVDHSADFPAFIKGSYFTNRSNDLNIFGPTGNTLMPAASEYLSRMLGDKGAYAYLNSYLIKQGRAKYKVIATDVPRRKGELIEYSLGRHIKGTATMVDHGPISAIAWRIELAGCSVVFSGDMTNQFNVLATLAKEADILVANNAIPEKASERAMGLHMKPSQIGLVAKQANVKKLLLSHFMKRTLSTQVESKQQIRKNYKGRIEMATDNMIIHF